MCRTVHALLSTAICGIQMLVRVFMTIILMIENLIRMILQTLYNFISFMLQMLSLIPICVVFLITARLKCFMCGGGGPCPVNRGGACDCLMSAAALIILFFIFRATGVLDKIFYKIGYVQAPPFAVVRFVPTPGDVTECSRNASFDDTSTTPITSTISTNPGGLLRAYDYTTEIETEEDTETTSRMTTILEHKTIFEPMKTVKKKISVKSLAKNVTPIMRRVDLSPILLELATASLSGNPPQNTTAQKVYVPTRSIQEDVTDNALSPDMEPNNLTTVLYYLV